MNLGCVGSGVAQDSAANILGCYQNQIGLLEHFVGELSGNVAIASDAGLGMLQGITDLLPTAEVGFLGIKRDEETLEPHTYANRLPDDLTGRQVYIIDPMLATGGTLIDSIAYVLERGASEVICICLIGAPEGVKAVEAAVGDANVTIVLGSLDSHLNEKGYIVPGLGDAGDRLFGTAN